MPWFAVRLIFSHPDLEVFEERITLWEAATIEDAIERAEVEAESYTEHIEAEYVGLAQGYGPLETEPADGSPCDGHPDRAIRTERHQAPEIRRPQSRRRRAGKASGDVRRR